MKVIGAGFGRTGTFSLKTALEELGLGPCHHMIELFGQPERAKLWQAAAEGEPVDWDQVFAGYHSTTDWPACTFYAQIMKAFPDAPVLLTVRDPDTWYESVTKTIHRSSAQTDAAPVAADADPVSRMITTVIWQGTFDGQFEDRTRSIAIYKRHIEEVRDRVPSNRLLVYDVQEGWEPLCRFLQVQPPARMPFPHLNDARSFLEAHDEAAAQAESA